MQFFTLNRKDFNDKVIKTRDTIINYNFGIINDYETYITNELLELLKIIKMYDDKLPKDFISINIMCELINICKTIFDNKNENLERFIEYYILKFKNYYDCIYIHKLLS
jgi:hypothetical protein